MTLPPEAPDGLPRTDPRTFPRTLDDVWEDGPHSGLPHVLLIVDQFPKALGGGERAALQMAELLPRYGFRASVLTFYIHPESAALAAPLPFPVYLLPLEKTYDLQAMRAALALGRFLRQQNVEIVQTFFESSDLWAGSVVKALSSARLVWSRRDMGILRSAKHGVAYRLLSRMPDRVFAVSEGVRRHCIEVDRVFPARVCTIYNGVSPESLRLAIRRENRDVCKRFAVTTVGNIRRVKGHDVLIRAAATVLEQFPEASFTIAGEILEPDYYAELQTLLYQLRIADRFWFLGGMHNIRQHLENADLFVLPSRSEGFSNAILEAMACSLPVIATDVGGNAEAVREGLTGLVIPSEDPTSLALAIARLATDRAAAVRMGAAGRRRVEEEFSTDIMMRRVTAEYSSMLHRSASSEKP